MKAQFYAFLVITLASCSTLQAQDVGWTSLFDGKTLKGWNNPYDYGESSVVDGEIHLVANKKFFLCTEKTYSDFIFEAELKMPEGPANSGILFRCHVEPNKAYGYQAECDTSDRAWSGGLYDEGRRGWLHPLKPNDSPSGDAFRDKTKGSFKRFGWNHYKIQAEGNRLRIWVNGVLCTDYTDDMDAEGYIGIQHHGEKGQLYQFRNLRIKELNSLEHGNQVSESQQQYIKKYAKQENIPTPESMLINTDSEPNLNQGFTSLYNGKNLNGWTPKGGTCTFEAKGNAIVGTCVEGSPSTYLSTDKADYDNFIFTAELKWEVNGNSGVMFRAQAKPGNNGGSVFGPQAEMEGFQARGWSGGIYGQSAGGWYYPLWLEAHAEARKAIKKDGWNRITILAQGDTFKTWINGIPAGHLKNDVYKQGFFSLQVHSGKAGKIHFRNIKVKEL